MLNEFSRTELLLGEESMNKLRNSHVAVFGIGGVGSYIAEGLARCGVGKLTLIDNDEVVLTNLNRQIIALHSTIGMKKTDAAKKRILDINPNSEVYAVDCFYTGGEVELTEFDYIADAIDTVSSKLALIENAYRLGIPIISSMGTGNKLDPLRLTVTDIYETRVCPLAKVMRRELKKRRVKKLKVVYSEEKPVRPLEDMAISCRTNCICPPGAQHKCTERRVIPGSTAFVPSVVGLIIAGEVVKDLCDYKRRDE
mgnify:FL=1